MSAQILRLFLRAALLAALATPFTASAALPPVPVDCSGATPGAFTTITAALASLPDQDGPYTVVVTGTCKESVALNGWQRLTIQSAVGTTATVLSTAAGKRAFEVRDSTALVFRRLIITGAGGGAILQRGSEALFEGTRLQGSNGVGLWLTGRSSAHLQGTVAEPSVVANNNHNGIFVLGGSFLWIQGDALIENNARQGIAVVAGAVLDGAGRSIIIRGNGGHGIRLDTAQAWLQGEEIYGNVGHGIHLQQASSLSLATVSIHGNGDAGIAVSRNSSVRMGVAYSAGPVTIAGNTGGDLTCDTTSLVAGDLSGVGQIECARIEREHGPPRPGEIVDLPDHP